MPAAGVQGGTEAGVEGGYDVTQQQGPQGLSKKQCYRRDRGVGGGAAFQKVPRLPSADPKAQGSMPPAQAPLQPGFWIHPRFSWCEGGLGVKGYIRDS